ncbi:methyltransferase domain-containing protein [Paenibacillus alba]|uniref:methyltransferase domain-containing protein n=1 Tax=Paenibacillus alba TaxID=1197127 RepID=UPI0015674F11|nr:methyltransferase domain-containing protein [Paenibacillus alba]
MNTGSYQVTKIASNVENEIERLKGQVELFWRKELKRYIEFGLRDGISLVELGSGPGFVIEKVKESFPNIQVTAVEIDSVLVNYAKNYFKNKKIENVKVIKKSIMETGLKNNNFDLAITRLVLEHLPDPLNAIREIHRILKPGGKAIFIDNDFEMHLMTCPHIPKLRKLYDAYCQSRYSEGGNPKIGRELPSLLKKGGFVNIDFEIINAHSEVDGDEKFFKSEGLGIPSKLVQEGVLSSKDLGEILIDWRNMLKNNNHSIIRQLYMAVGEKTLQ